ncbi:MAG: Lytic transglycosylase catalytic, partial [Thermoleophilia bacterium]|nr:Lytic transglycosylase catalytic [Thermoleophilia bacterium]
QPATTPAERRAAAAAAKAAAKAARAAAAAAAAEDTTDDGTGGDARLFRESYVPKGRIPEQPRLTAVDATLLQAAAKGTSTDWSLLAAIAWQENDFRSSGNLLGANLTDAAWKAYGRDGNGDGTVSRTNRADQARTVATYLGGARSTEAASLRAYYAASHTGFHVRRTVFLADWFDALGTTALVRGLSSDEAKEELAQRVLADEDADIYEGGRGDIEAGLIDPRVLMTIEFLRARFGTVHVTCLISGHNVFTAGGNVSLHSMGQGVDIGSLGGEVITPSTQTRGSNIWRAVRELLLLPESSQPKEIISLWDMGGASFALPDHDDHLHVGYANEADDAK